MPASWMRIKQTSIMRAVCLAFRFGTKGMRIKSIALIPQCYRRVVGLQAAVNRAEAVLGPAKEITERKGQLLPTRLSGAPARGESNVFPYNHHVPSRRRY